MKLSVLVVFISLAILIISVVLFILGYQSIWIIGWIGGWILLLLSMMLSKFEDGERTFSKRQMRNMEKEMKKLIEEEEELKDE